VSVDYVVVAVAHGAGFEQRGIRTGRRRLGHRETTSHLAGEHRIEPAFLLLRCAELEQNLHIARVRGCAVEHPWCEQAAPHDFAKQAVLPVRQSRAVLTGEKQVPQSLRARLVVV